MTKSNNEWVPEIGQEFSYGCWSWGEKYRSGECGVWGKLKAISDDYLIVENANGKEHPLHREGLMMSPIKTEAEKRRDDNFRSLVKLVNGFVSDNDGSINGLSAYLFDQGVKILSDNQSIATKLSHEQRAKINFKLRANPQISNTEIMDLIEGEILGEDS